MLFKSRFFYNDGAGEGGGSSVENTAENNTENNQQEQQQNNEGGEKKFELPEDIAKELEELRAFRQANQKAPEKTPEEVKKEQEKEKAEFLKYAVENDLLSLDDYTKNESLSVKADADLVFEQFIQDFKEENPDITDDAELAEAAKEEFNKTYKLDSTNEKAKEKGLAKLAKEANEIRSPYKSKIEQAKSSFEEERQVREKMPSFEKFVDQQISKVALDKVPFKIKKGDEEIVVEVELTKEDKEAIAKEFKSPKTFYKYSKSPEEAEKSLEKKINGWVRVNKMEQAIEKALEIGEGRGIKQGSNVGAEAPFAVRQGQRLSAVKSGLSLEQSNERLAKIRAQYS